MSAQFIEILDKKTTLESQLKELEQQICNLENQYLEETMNTGNIIKGWESYLTNQPLKPQNYPSNKKLKINPNDKIFSLSSTSSPAVDGLEENLDRNINAILGASSNLIRSKRKKVKKNYNRLSNGSESEGNDDEGEQQDESMMNADMDDEDVSNSQDRLNKKIKKFQKDAMKKKTKKYKLKENHQS